MARTCGLAVLACARGGGRLRLIARIEETAVIARILRHVGLPIEIPAPRPPTTMPFRDREDWDDDTWVIDPCC
jgi:hypothetical protein